MEYKTRQWHEKCFCCCVCKTAIGTKSFIPREQEIYCAGCYEEKYATRCIKCKKVSWSSPLDQNRRRFVTVWRLSRRSSPAAVWPTRTNRGTVSASRAPTARCRWPASASPAATRSRTVPSASGSCSPRDAPPVSSQLPVSLPFWAHFGSVLPLALLNCQKVWGYANVLPSFFPNQESVVPVSSRSRTATGTTIASSARSARHRWSDAVSSPTSRTSSVRSAPSRNWCKL